jgi:5-deoxy-glucuronate isomerase
MPELYRPWPAAAGPEPGDLVLLTPEDAAWDYAGLRVIRLEPGVARTVATGEVEAFVLPLAGALALEVASSSAPELIEARFDLAGRASVFERVTDFGYVGRDSLIRLISAAGAEVALPTARCEHRLPPKYGPAEEVPVDLRGSGPATRQVTNFGSPGAWDHAERLIACELITPGGNWSSYPPHKHDLTEPCPAPNEEIYFFKVAGPDGVTPSREGFGLHRTFTGPEHAKAGLPELDETVEVRDGDVFCIPYGYHGPCVAAPGYDLYYLNVLAGPGTGADRTMAFCDDPAHAWIRSTWRGLPPDPRCPLTSAEGRRQVRPSEGGDVGAPPFGSAEPTRIFEAEGAIRCD